MKNDKPHGQWIVLHALLTLPPFGNTSDAIREAAHHSISRSGARTRCKELADMSLLEAENREGSKNVLYHITPIGWKVANSGADGMTALRMMRATHATLEAKRAIELAPIKERWRNTIKNEMTRLSLGL